MFWSGDLNYRVTCERDVAEKAILSNNLEVSHIQVISAS